MADLLYQDISVRLGQRVAVRDASLALRPGELVALIGPNGAGKTSLLRAGLGLLPIDSGKVLLNGADPRMMPAGMRARAAAYLPQARPLAWPMQVRDVVALGRFAYGAQIGQLKAEDARAVDAAMEACDLTALAVRSTDALSGGELARVHIARALAATTPMILADEPAAALDPRHAHQIMALCKAFCLKGGAALVTLHDLGLAARYADRIALMEGGRLVMVDTPANVLTPARIAAVFGVVAEISAQGAVTLTGPA